jgi:cell division protein FtsL
MNQESRVKDQETRNKDQETRIKDQGSRNKKIMDGKHRNKLRALDKNNKKYKIENKRD